MRFREAVGGCMSTHRTANARMSCRRQTYTTLVCRIGRPSPSMADFERKSAMDVHGPSLMSPKISGASTAEVERYGGTAVVG